MTDLTPNNLPGPEPLSPAASEDRLNHARFALATPPPEPPTAIGPEWQPCVKLPITVHVREQRPGETHSSTREGITPLRSDDLIMRGVQGEEYPIGRELFNQTYRMGATPPPEPPKPPTDDELNRLRYYEFSTSTGHGESVDVLGFARAALERWGHR
jgi:hypothetical protein